MMAHTPKPWTYGVRRGGSIWISRGDHRKGPHHQGDFIGTEDDARLTIAAPELLETAKGILVAFDTDAMTPEQFNAWCAIESAVTKAEGKL